MPHRELIGLQRDVKVRQLPLVAENPAIPDIPPVLTAFLYDEGDPRTPRIPILEFEPDTLYTLRFHWRASGKIDWYVDGGFVMSYQSSGDPELGFMFGVYTNHVEDPNVECFFSNLKIGTTPGGTEIFHDPLTSIPVMGSDYNFVASDGITTDGTKLTINGGSFSGTGWGGNSQTNLDLSGYTDLWFEYDWGAPAKILNAATDSFLNTAVIFTETFQTGGEKEGVIFLFNGPAPDKTPAIKCLMQGSDVSTVYKEFAPGDISLPVYVEAEIWIDSKILHALGLYSLAHGVGFLTDIMWILGDDGIRFQNVNLDDDFRTATDEIANDDNSPGTTLAFSSWPATLGDTWVTYKYVVNTPNVSIYINGTLLKTYQSSSDPIDPSNTVGGYAFGPAQQTSGVGITSDMAVYLRNIKIGSTDGGDDLLAETSSIASFETVSAGCSNVNHI